MKKILTRFALASGTLAIVVAGAAAFSAFEAHVVNVTATINNALTVPQEASGISFGAVFPEEVAHMPLNVSLSTSFLNESRVDDVSYMIRQKPKCLSDDPNALVKYPQVTEDGNIFVCPTGSTMMPLLCPYLSKTELDASGAPTTNAIPAFHGPLTGWTLTDTINSQILGHLAKSDQNASDNWDIDLHAPCFKGMCAQDNVIPANYQPDPALNGKTFGCDLWVEVTGISLPKETGTLIVIKKVDNSNGGTAVPGSFTMSVNGVTAVPASFPGADTPGTSVSVAPGNYNVTETGPAGYSESNSADCTGSIAAGETKTCTVTNTHVLETGTLTVIKHVDNTGGGTATAGQFTINVTGVGPFSTAFPGSEVGTNVTLTAGSYEVSESAGPSGYTAGYSGDCTGTIAAGETKTCTVTNSFNFGTITVHKSVNNNEVGTLSAGDFQMTIDGNNVAQDTPIPVSVGVHTISEVDSKGYVKTVGVDCASNGTVTVNSGENKNCTVTNDFPFFTVTVNKVVNNIHGGNNVVNDFSLFVGAFGATSGVSKKVAVGTYLINESGVDGYDAAFSGDCDSNTQLLTGANGDNKVCTITNTDISPNVHLIKNVVGGTKNANDFLMRVDGVPVPSGGSKSVTSNGAGHVITEDSLAGYHFTSMTGTGSQGSLCPATLGGSVTLNEGETITCTITNTAD